MSCATLTARATFPSLYANILRGACDSPSIAALIADTVHPPAPSLGGESSRSTSSTELISLVREAAADDGVDGGRRGGGGSNAVWSLCFV